MDFLKAVSLFLMALFVQLNAEDSSVRLCTREGIQCKDCYTVGNCVKNGTKGYKYDDSTDLCPGDVVCDETTWFCARKGFCRFKKFECPPNNFDKEILFPDPYSCTAYHGCQGTDQYDYYCEDGTAFNPVTQDCSLKLNNRYCIEYPVPICEETRQAGAISGTNYVYECVEDLGPPRTIYPKLNLRNN